MADFTHQTFQHFSNMSFTLSFFRGLLWWLSGKDSACSVGDAGDVSSIPGSGSFPEEGNGNPLQCPCLGNPMDRGAWWAIVHEAARVGYILANIQHHHQAPSLKLLPLLINGNPL